MRVLYVTTTDAGIPKGLSNEETIVAKNDSVAYENAAKYFDLIKNRFVDLWDITAEHCNRYVPMPPVCGLENLQESYFSTGS